MQKRTLHQAHVTIADAPLTFFDWKPVSHACAVCSTPLPRLGFHVHCIGSCSRRVHFGCAWPSTGLNSLPPAQATSNARILCPDCESNRADPALVFPTEILEHVVSYLTAKEARKCLLLSKRWRAVSGSNSVWRPICKRLGIPLSYGQMSKDKAEVADSDMPAVGSWFLAYKNSVLEAKSNWTGRYNNVFPLDEEITYYAYDDKVLAATSSLNGLHIYEIGFFHPTLLSFLQLPAEPTYLLTSCGVVTVLTKPSVLVYKRTGDEYSLWAAYGPAGPSAVIRMTRSHLYVFLTKELHVWSLADVTVERRVRLDQQYELYQGPTALVLKQCDDCSSILVSGRKEVVFTFPEEPIRYVTLNDSLVCFVFLIENTLCVYDFDAHLRHVFRSVDTPFLRELTVHGDWGVSYSVAKGSVHSNIVFRGFDGTSATLSDFVVGKTVSFGHYYRLSMFQLGGELSWYVHNVEAVTYARRGKVRPIVNSVRSPSRLDTFCTRQKLQMVVYYLRPMLIE